MGHCGFNTVEKKKDNGFTANGRVRRSTEEKEPKQNIGWLVVLYFGSTKYERKKKKNILQILFFLCRQTAAKIKKKSSIYSRSRKQHDRTLPPPP